MWRVALLLITAAPILTAQKPTTHPYYPLAVGNTWQYLVQTLTPRGRASKIVWRVTKEDRSTPGRIVYQVWPTPMQADDEAMQLTVSDSGVEEVGSRNFVLKSPLGLGDHWLGGDPGLQGHSPAAFRVLSVGQPCSAGSKRFRDCAVVEEVDPGTRMRTVTTYANGVGPVEYKYFRIGPSGKQDEVQTVELDSYRIVR